MIWVMMRDDNHLDRSELHGKLSTHIVTASQQLNTQSINVTFNTTDYRQEEVRNHSKVSASSMYELTLSCNAS